METTAQGLPPVAAATVLRAVRAMAVFMVDPQGRIASWSEGVGLMLHWEESEWIGQPLSVAFTPEDVAAGVPEQEMQKAAATGRADDTRWMRRKGGERFFALGEMTRVVDDAGRIVGFVKALRDDSEVHAAAAEREQLVEAGRDLDRVETALRERDAELRALVDGVRDYAIFTVSPEGMVSSWYPGAALMLGHDAAEAVGMPVAELFTPEDRAAGLPEREMAVAAATGVYQGEGRRRRKDGSVFDAAAVVTSLQGGGGRLRGYLVLTHDITARKQVERQRQATLADAQAARIEAERTSRAKDEFLATISHELRTPLAAIVGWANVLERGGVEPQTLQHGLAAISRNARAQVQLIEDLLDMNRIESGQLRVDMQRVDLGAVIAAAVDAAVPAATAKRIGLRTAFGPDVGAVLGDASRLQQVVGNLLNNAIKFTPAGGQISVALTQWADVAQIAVADTGQGIDPDFVARVFDRFGQQDATTTRRHGGLGIGLAIVQQLVRLHGGTVRAHSLGTGLGSTFTVTLPVLPQAARPPPAAVEDAAAVPEPTAAPPRLDGLTVLVVDDEQDVRAVTRHMLEQAGACVWEADGAARAIELLRRERPAVILSDIGMPGVDGYEFIRRVRAGEAEEGGATPAAAFTAYTRDEDRQRALDAGYQLHLSKPLTSDSLLRAVAQLAGCRAGPPA